MSVKNFSSQQREALLDLLLMAMYADGHLAGAEDRRVQELLDEMAFASAYERTQQYDAAVARTRQHRQTPGDAIEQVSAATANFSTPEQQELVARIIQDFLAADGKVDARENVILSSILRSFKK